MGTTIRQHTNRHFSIIPTGSIGVSVRSWLGRYDCSSIRPSIPRRMHAHEDAEAGGFGGCDNPVGVAGSAARRGAQSVFLNPPAASKTILARSSIFKILPHGNETNSTRRALQSPNVTQDCATSRGLYAFFVMHPFFPTLPLGHGQFCVNWSRPHSGAPLAERKYLPLGRTLELVAVAAVPNKNTGETLCAWPL
jgi:hypothetical protein